MDEKLVNLLEKLVSAAGKKAEELWPFAVKSVFSEGVVDVIFGVTSLAFFVLAPFIVWKVTAKLCEGQGNSDHPGAWIPRILFTLVSLVGFFISGALLPVAITKIVNPEGYLLRIVIGR